MNVAQQAIFRVQVLRPEGTHEERVREDALDAFVDNVCSNYPDACLVTEPEDVAEKRELYGEA